MSLLIVVGILAALPAIDLLCSRIVMGRFLKDSEMNDFVENKLPEYVFNTVSNQKIIRHKSDWDLPSISKVPSFFGAGFVAKYYVMDYGIVPRWTKAHAAIESKYAQLRATAPKEELKTLNKLAQ